MAKCKDCGYELQGDEMSCPQCGCPTRVAIDNYVLENGKNTQAEAIVTDVADSILKWGKIFAWIALIVNTLMGIIFGGFAREGGVMFFTIVFGIIVGIIMYLFIKFLAKVIWGVIMLFVNMSTTLKRIEIQIKNK